MVGVALRRTPIKSQMPWDIERSQTLDVTGLITDLICISADQLKFGTNDSIQDDPKVDVTDTDRSTANHELLGISIDTARPIERPTIEPYLLGRRRSALATPSITEPSRLPSSQHSCRDLSLARNDWTRHHRRYSKNKLSCRFQLAGLSNHTSRIWVFFRVSRAEQHVK